MWEVGSSLDLAVEWPQLMADSKLRREGADNASRGKRSKSIQFSWGGGGGGGGVSCAFWYSNDSILVCRYLL